MSQQEASKPLSLKSALTPGQPALSPQLLLKLIRLLPLISVLVSAAIVAHQYSRRNWLRTHIVSATKELDALEKREAELMKSANLPYFKEKDDHKD